MRSLRLIGCLSLLSLLLSFSAYAESDTRVISGNAGSKLSARSWGAFNEPWAMTFLPDGDLLITEKKRHLDSLQSG